MNIAFLASHNGSNMQAVIDACRDSRLLANPCVVISNNNSNSEALARAKRENIPYFHLSSQTHPNPTDLDEAMLQALEQYQSDLVILAGYMRQLGQITLSKFRGRILNIHPALLPKYGGPGMFGRHVHEAILAAGEKSTGVTIHLIDEEYDHGQIVAQCQVPVLPNDSPDTLAARVLEKEHGFLVDAIFKIISGEIILPTQPL
jgi:phosphoribosylglycinamide formyltransferase-1